MADEFSLKMPDFHVTFMDLLHAVNLRRGTNGFTSLPKEGVLRIFSPWKIRRLRSGLNPRTWVPKASTLPLDHRSRIVCYNSVFVFELRREYSYLLRYGAVSYVKKYTDVSEESNKTWLHRHCCWRQDTSKRRLRFTNRHCAEYWKTWIFISTALKPSNL